MADVVQDWFHLGVVAPLGFSSPDLSAVVERSLFGLLARRRAQSISITTVIGEPIAWAVGAASERYGWHVGYRGSPRWPPTLGLVRVAVELAAWNDALVIFFGDVLANDLVRIRDLCPWLGTQVRCVPVRDRQLIR